MSRLALLPLLVPLLASASPMTASEAKGRADASEASLSDDQSARLLSAQAAVAKSAFPDCMTTTGAKPSDFTVVVELSARGRVLNAWLTGESDFARCFRDAMVKRFEYVPPQAPFFTSFEYTNRR
jgi:hypothetical protein